MYTDGIQIRAEVQMLETPPRPEELGFIKAPAIYRPGLNPIAVSHTKAGHQQAQSIQVPVPSPDLQWVASLQGLDQNLQQLTTMRDIDQLWYPINRKTQMTKIM